MREEENYTVEIVRDSETRVAYFELWRLAGSFHREGAPARIHRDRKTGAILKEYWEHHGNTHRDDGPAVIKRRADGSIYYTAWYQHGEKMQPPKRSSGGPEVPKQPSPTIG